MSRSLRLPWFRVHIVVLSDPGRLISVHLMHTALVAGWCGTMLLYELMVIDPCDPVLNPLWRQSSYVLPFNARLGVVTSISNWGLGLSTEPNFWSFESVVVSHILLSGLLILSSFWHWCNWDLDIFIVAATRTVGLDLLKVFGIHLFLSAVSCFGFGYLHLTGLSGPGMWTCDNLGLLGSLRFVKPFYSLSGLTRWCYGAIPSHHIVSGFVGILVCLWHLTARPGALVYRSLRCSNVETVLSSSLGSVLFTGLLLSSTMWYGSVTSSVDLFGPSRYNWDNGYFQQDIDSRVASVDLAFTLEAWEQIPDRIILYDYLGCNPAKGGLFRAGPLILGDGLIKNWLGNPGFELGATALSVRRMPAFFETFPVLLIDRGGNLRADIPFRRGGSRYSLEQTQVIVYFSGGILSGTQYSSPSLLKNFARKSQFGSIFTFDRKSIRADGVFRTSVRGWYAFSHTSFSIIFIFGHLWHASRTLFKSIWTGVSLQSAAIAEFGGSERLGDTSSSTPTLI